MVSEERYIIDLEIGIIDTETDTILDTIEKTVDTLNEQDQEIKRLENL